MPFDPERDLDTTPASFFEKVASNATSGHGPCSSCPASASGNARYVGPGAGDLDARVLVAVDEPSHAVTWAEFEDWDTHQEWFDLWFPSTDRGSFLATLFEPLGIDLSDVWVANTLKCPTGSSENPAGGDSGSGDPESNGRSDDARERDDAESTVAGTDDRDVADIDTNSAVRHCVDYLRSEIRKIDPAVVLGLGPAATARAHYVLGVSWDDASAIDVTATYGPSPLDTDVPVVICPGTDLSAPAADQGPDEQEVREAVRAGLDAALGD